MFGFGVLYHHGADGHYISEEWTAYVCAVHDVYEYGVPSHIYGWHAGHLAWEMADGTVFTFCCAVEPYLLML